MDKKLDVIRVWYCENCGRYELNFDIDIAKQYGVDEAILLNNLAFWILKNQACEKHYY